MLKIDIVKINNDLAVELSFREEVYKFDPKMANQLIKVFDYILKKGIKNIFIDFEKVKYVNSFTIGKFAIATTRCKEKKGVVVIKNALPHIKNAFKAVNLNEIISFENSQKAVLDKKQ